uniref:Heparan-alpha-glucosaminide N-acetyltransferase catalytic domain-containing protein n=1 Tax=Vespula pensylvanica TaxID=30213 RepID=A0A834P664_VESPE|nr:hypothetical protein H0235_006150 [Vespula pensylvanica]
MASVIKQATNVCLNSNRSLGIDQACLSIINKYKQNLTFYSTFSECRLCHGIPTTNLSAESNTTLLVSTKYPLHMYYMTNLEWCHTTYVFKEHGSYGWNLSAKELCSDIYVINEPSDAYFRKVILRAIKYYFERDTTYIHDDLTRLQESESPVQPIMNITRLSTRIQSVDTFRGIAILLMIFVNNGGGEYVFFNHSAWFGLTVADLVLPWFAWIMGLTIAISKRAELRNTSSRSKIILRNFARSLVLIVLGLMINSQKSKYLEDLRFPGVLQLLAISYFVCTVIETIFMKSHLQFGRFFILGDILENWIQWLIILSIVTAHTLITFLLPVANCPKGYLGPGGYDTFKKYINCTGGAAGYIDRYVFGNHMYAQTQNPVYGVILRHDPEGMLLSILNGIIAGFLCNFSKEDGIIPLSKKMMTISFVLTTCSFAFLLFAILYYLIDYKQFWTGTPFVYAGANSIFLYIGHSVTMGLFPWSWKENDQTHSTQLVINLWTTALWLLIAHLLYKKDIVITV